MRHLTAIKSILKEIKPELEKRYHVQTIGLFGSVVRDDFKPESDVDILVEFSAPIGIEFVDLGDFLESKINRKVDLVSRKGIKDNYFKAIEGELVYV